MQIHRMGVFLLYFRLALLSGSTGISRWVGVQRRIDLGSRNRYLAAASRGSVNAGSYPGVDGQSYDQRPMNSRSDLMPSLLVHAPTCIPSAFAAVAAARNSTANLNTSALLVPFACANRSTSLLSLLDRSSVSRTRATSPAVSSETASLVGFSIMLVPMHGPRVWTSRQHTPRTVDSGCKFLRSFFSPKVKALACCRKIFAILSRSSPLDYLKP